MSNRMTVATITLSVLATFCLTGCSRSEKNARGLLNQARVHGLKEIDELEGALGLFQFDVGRYPTTEEGLKGLISGPGIKDWSGPYLDKPKIPKDPWGKPYGYKSPGDGSRGFDLWSLGSDGKPGGSGAALDILSW